MLLEIFCPKCGSKREEDFWIPYVDTHVPEELERPEELEYGICRKCKVVLVWRKLK